LREYQKKFNFFNETFFDFTRASYLSLLITFRSWAWERKL